MTERTHQRPTAQARFPTWGWRRGLVNELVDLTSSELFVALLLLEFTDAGGYLTADAVSLARCTRLSVPTVRRALARLEQLELVSLTRGRATSWNRAHPVLADLLASESATRTRAPVVASAPAPEPLSAEDRALLDELRDALSDAKARRLGVSVIGRSTLPSSDACRLLAGWVRDQERALELERPELLARVSREYVAHDGRDGRLRDAGWPLAWLHHDLARIAILVAKRIQREAAAAPQQTTEAPPELSRAAQYAAAQAARAAAGGAR